MASTSSSFRLNAVIPVLLLALVFAAFFRNITAGFVWDDWFVLVGNPRFNPPTFASIVYYWTHISWNLYQPLTCTAWAILSKISYVDTPDGSGGHLDPTVLHVGCIVLHAFTTLALYRLLRLLTSTTWPAAIGAAIFAVHPIQVEAVAFIGAINNPLSAILSLLAMTDYLQATSAGTSAPCPRWIWWRGTTLFVLAILAKPTAVIVPAIAMVLDAARNDRSYRALMISALPGFCWLFHLQFAQS